MRYLPQTAESRRDMLSRIGVGGIDDLFQDVPADLRNPEFPTLSDHLGELAVERRLADYAAQSVSPAEVPSFLGCGTYRHHIPATVDHLIQRSEYLTAYTPYQPEISQGTLQTLFEFQTQVAMITGMEVANASMYDGATATAEAVLMAHRVAKKKTRTVVSGNLNPHYADTTRTMLRYTDFELAFGDATPASDEDLLSLVDDNTAAVVVQNPDVFGRVRDLTPLADELHQRGVLLIVSVTEALSLGLVASPGEMGADIVVGEGQSIGVATSFGGPHVGLFACRQKYVRQMPGRLAGETVDQDGRRGFVLTLNAREQHIRREKATSNICTNAGLCSLAFSIHMSLLGEAGFTGLAEVNHRAASAVADRLASIDGVELLTDAFFNEFTVKLNRPAAPIVDQLAREGVLAGIPASRLYGDGAGVDDLLILAVTELNTEDDVATLEAALQEVLA